MACPEIVGLCGDVSNIIISPGMVRYKMSMVDRTWNRYLTNRVRNAYPFGFQIDIEQVILNEDLLAILYDRSFVGTWMNNACRLGITSVIKMCMRVSNATSLIHNGFKYACMGGHVPTIKYMTRLSIQANERGAVQTDWDAGFQHVCVNGDVEMVQYIIDRADKLDLKCGFNRACGSGKLHVVELLLPMYHATSTNDWDMYLDSMTLGYACYGGNMTIVEIVMRLGFCDWNDGLVNACLGGNVAVAKLMIERGATSVNRGLIMASKANNMEVAQLMMDHGAGGIHLWNELLYDATKYGHLDFVKLAIERGANDFSHVLHMARILDHKNVISYLEPIIGPD